MSTCFKKHFREITKKRQHGGEFSTLFFNLPLINDRKEKMNQFRDNDSLNPIDCSLVFLNSVLPDSNVTFQPPLLNSNNPEKRDISYCISFSRQLAETSNANLIWNADSLLASNKNGRDNITIKWVRPSKQRYDSTKFKLTYWRDRTTYFFLDETNQNYPIYLCN